MINSLIVSNILYFSTYLGPKAFISELSIWSGPLKQYQVRALYGSRNSVRAAGIDDVIELLGMIDTEREMERDMEGLRGVGGDKKDISGGQRENNGQGETQGDTKVTEAVEGEVEVEVGVDGSSQINKLTKNEREKQNSNDNFDRTSIKAHRRDGILTILNAIKSKEKETLGQTLDLVRNQGDNLSRGIVENPGDSQISSGSSESAAAEAVRLLLEASEMRTKCSSAQSRLVQINYSTLLLSDFFFG